MPHTPEKSMGLFTDFGKKIRDALEPVEKKPPAKKPGSAEEIVHEKEIVHGEESDHEEQTDSDHEPEEETTSGSSVIRQNFPPKVEALLNKQINLQFQACYSYRSMGIYFDRDDVALPGFSKFFMENAEKKKKSAKDMMKYMNKRGGCVVFEDIPKPPVDKWGTPLIAMASALDMEKHLNKILIKVHKLTLKHCDPHAEEFVKKYLIIKVEIIKKLGDHLTNLKRVGPGRGVYLFGRKTLGGEVICSPKHKHNIESDSDSD